ncbi:PTS sugar transporter subunit IIA [Bacillus horti]|uniref:Ascorbate-specific PTS system EIIA component n=1 Tax=Caldalkalibacillus horti TaxID=77523 RepID=A0ABT9W1D3_9BACI|nr:mannitol/fructose-specific phosphotransferase system IIA component (Ntr-type) [Bacillus horti]
MLDQLLQEEFIQLKGHVLDWKDAIRVAAQPLLDNGAIEAEYVQAMIRSVEELGPYIVIAPKIALPHARPEQGVKRMGMSLLTLKEAVPFSEKKEHEVQLIVVLAAVDDKSHLKALSQLSMLLSEGDNTDKLIKATDKEMIRRYIVAYSDEEGEDQ